MGATVEALPGRTQGLRASAIRKPIALRMRGFRALVEPDGSLRSFDALRERRSVFGFEHAWIYKVQAGVVVQAQRPDWTFRLTPRSVQIGGRVFESIDVVQSVEFFQGASSGYVRRVRLKNSGSVQFKLRLIDIMDPTAAQLGGSSGRWGSLGVNAFNRGSHVAMDEISDPPSARVVGAYPSPKKFFMTTDRGRAQDLLAAGELPDPTAGMSGQVIVMSLHEFDLAPSEAKEVVLASIYSPTRLEDALSDFSRLEVGEKAPRKQVPLIACSSPTLTEAAAWAVAVLEGARFTADILDRFESLKALSHIDPDEAKSLIIGARGIIRKDGSMPHSLDAAEAGLLESAVLLQAASAHLLLANDKKLTRSLYPFLRKLAGFLMTSSRDNSVQTSPSLPQGWRRSLGRGYPTGEIPEVSLAAAGALAGVSQAARQISKPDDAGRFRERAEMIAERVRKRLLDDRGFLSLCLDSSGRLRNDETADMAVAAYRRPFLPSAEQAAVHRLLEKDFETPYGPRTVPQSNQLYFNPSYGRGQLGGFWTRAALAHALLCYRTGLAGMGSLGLEKVAKLVIEDSIKLGGSPGEFPYWVDVEGRESHGDESDPVSAARLVQGFLEGELGLEADHGEVSFSPQPSSSLKWVLAADLWAGEPATMFVGRGGGKVHAFAGGTRLGVKPGTKYSRAELLESPAKGLYAVSFSGPGQAICIGNASAAPARGALSFAPRAAELSKRLSTPLEEYDRTKGAWEKVATLRVFPTMIFEASLGPGDWKAFRVSTP